MSISNIFILERRKYGFIMVMMSSHSRSRYERNVGACVLLIGNWFVCRQVIFKTANFLSSKVSKSLLILEGAFLGLVRFFFFGGGGRIRFGFVKTNSYERHLVCRNISTGKLKEVLFLYTSWYKKFFIHSNLLGIPTIKSVHAFLFLQTE